MLAAVFPAGVLRVGSLRHPSPASQPYAVRLNVHDENLRIFQNLKLPTESRVRVIARSTGTGTTGMVYSS